jgi:hypothetical protein
MQSWEAKVLLEEQNKITQVILQFGAYQTVSATASKLVDYYRLCTSRRKATAEPFFKLEGSTIMQNLL